MLAAPVIGRRRLIRDKASVKIILKPRFVVKREEAVIAASLKATVQDR